MALNIIFMGTPEFSVPILGLYTNLDNIITVYTQKQKKKDRDKKLK